MPEVSITGEAGTDNRLVRVAHEDGHFIEYRQERGEGYLHTYDVSSSYGDWHDSHADRAACEGILRAHAEYLRLTGPDLGFPSGMAQHLAMRAEQRGWLPVADPMRPAGPDNVQVSR